MPIPTISEMQEDIFHFYVLAKSLPAVQEDTKPPDNYLRKLDELAAKYESSIVNLRNYREQHYQAATSESGKPMLIPHTIAGRIEINEFGWLHIELDSLLPHCRYSTPVYLTDTITRLLDEYERTQRRLPRLDTAALVIDEHCDIDSRIVYDQDNKGYKAIPNALKGRLITDDDQFHLHLHLISTRSKKTACHIWLLRQDEVGEFFYQCCENSLLHR